ncbi:MAG: FAD-dependent oxidoreductase [Candidatus Melainabacteria bacterium HGW-Melainabacteria-1]|nr:MAG: FAD-dependent oxidoreductase [Candidatus Melainabacteria bacterium HGW-Melainabacteria-1]
MNPAQLHTAEMTPEPEATLPLWIDSVDMPAYPQLGQQALSAEVCVIGAGIAGLTTAYLLAKAGKSVVLLEMGGIGSGQTGRTSAHISTAIDDRYLEIERIHGAEASQLVADSQIGAIDLIEQIVLSEGINCGFERLDGYLFLGPEHEESLLDRELAAAHRAGLKRVVKLPSAPLHAFHTGPVLKFPDQGSFHPLQYLIGLAEAACRLGVKIFTYSKVEQLAGGTPCRAVVSEGGSVESQALVVCTHSPISNVLVMHSKQVAYRSYVVAYRVPRSSIEKGLYWDSQDPYHYLRLWQPPAGHFDVLLVGGEDHKCGQSDNEQACFQALDDWVSARFPMLHDLAWQWSGQVLEPVDGLMYAGRVPLQDNHIYLISGDSGMGMTNCTAGAMIVSALIQGQEHPWAAIYDPARKPLSPALGSYVKANAEVAVTLIGDRLGPPEVTSLMEIAPGMGALYKHGLHKLAVYRGLDGKLHALSSKCTHLGCLVHWNSAENSWDCPCHGSRFSVHGEVLNGPTTRGLQQIELEDDWHLAS